MLRIAATVTAVLLLSLGPGGEGRAASAPASLPGPANASAGYEYRIRRITERVHLISQVEPFHVQPLGNVTVIEQSDGLVLVDAGGSRRAGLQIARLVRSISDKPVKAILLTHWHADHVLGAAALLETWPSAQLLSSEVTRAHLAGREMAMYPRDSDPAAEVALQAQLGQTAERMADAAGREGMSAQERSGFARTAQDVRAHAAALRGVRLVFPHRVVADGERIEDVEAPIEIRLPGPANTDGDAMAWLPRQQVLVTGDIVVAPIPFGFDVHPSAWAALLERLAASEFRFLIPGHGAVQTDPSYLSRVAGALRRITAQVRSARAADVPAAEIAARLDNEAEIEAFAGSDPWLRRWARAYWWAPVVASAIVESEAR
jgi:glyoxylase-like metal-dependent hydrolase (beta-lactamase superfamily II)